MLEVRKLSARYGLHQALEDVSLSAKANEIVVILGANGAGKSTLLKALGGLVASTGQVMVGGKPTHGLPAHKIVEAGLALVPEGRGIFGELTVQENLTLGAYARRARADETVNLDRVFSLFPRLTERRTQLARTMSGGEQQMVAIGRAMMSAPDVLMLDEPSLGLSPLLCRDLFKALDAIRAAGTSVLLVEQNARQSLAIADRAYLLENARIVGEGTAADLARDPAVQKAYLGGAATTGPVTSPATSPVVSAIAMKTPLVNEALTNEALASVATASSGGTVSREDIESLVLQAAQTQEQDVLAARQDAGATGLTSESSPGTTVPDIVAQIESAAAQASNRGRSSRPRVHVIRPGKPPARPTRTPPNETPDKLTTPVKVWRRSGVRVYKRKRLDGPLERTDDTD